MSRRREGGTETEAVPAQPASRMADMPIVSTVRLTEFTADPPEPAARALAH